MGTALVSAAAGLIGALIGAFSAQIAARKTRQADRIKRCVDRVLAAATELDKAYAAYVTQTIDKPDDPIAALPLHVALRTYDQSVHMLDNRHLRAAAMRYRDNMKEFYLVYGQPRDPLDDGRDVPTLQQLNAEHAELSEKLRRYERI
ncbi:hypothetical protein [Mycolicibacterium sp. A43C]